MKYWRGFLKVSNSVCTNKRLCYNYMFIFTVTCSSPPTSLKPQTACHLTPPKSPDPSDYPLYASTPIKSLPKSPLLRSSRSKSPIHKYSPPLRSSTLRSSRSKSPLRKSPPFRSSRSKSPLRKSPPLRSSRSKSPIN